MYVYILKYACEGASQEDIHNEQNSNLTEPCSTLVCIVWWLWSLQQIPPSEIWERGTNFGKIQI